jgi:hypothetical protein
MSYTNEKQAFHRHTSSVFGSTTIKGVKGFRASYEVRRNPISADGNLGPTANPAQSIYQSSTLRFLDGNGVQAYSATAASLVHNMSKADGTTGSITQATMVASSWDLEAENPEGGYVFQQTYDVEAATPSTSISH